MEAKRKNLIVTLFCVAAFCVFSFLCIGFAAIQTDLTIGGSVSIKSDAALLSKAKLRAGLRKTPNVKEIFIGNFEDDEVKGLSRDNFIFIADISDEIDAFGNSIALYTIKTIDTEDQTEAIESGLVAYILASGSCSVKFPAYTGAADPKLTDELAPDYAAHSDHPGYYKGCAYIFASYFPNLDAPAEESQGFDKVPCLKNVTQIIFGKVDFSDAETGEKSFSVDQYKEMGDKYEALIVGENGYNAKLDQYNNGIITTAPTEPVAKDIFGEVPKYRMFFHCESLTSIDLPDTIVKIAPAMFRGCYALKSVHIPKDVTCIGSVAFGDCYNLESINIPEKVESIGVSSFIWCSKLGNVTIPSKVETIRANTFRGCQNFTEVNVPNGVKSIGEYAFANCVKVELQNVDGENKYVAVGGINKVKIGDDVTTIGTKAFYQCNLLKNLEMGNKVSMMGDDVFLGCIISDAKIPTIAITSVKSGYLINVEITSGDTIGEYAFNGCWYLESITMSNSVKVIEVNAFDSCGHINEIVIGSGVETIKSKAFNGCWGLAKITMPATVKSVAEDAFVGCAVATAKIPALACKAVSTNGSGKGYIKNVEIISGTAIDAEAFWGCANLESVYIASTVTSIGANAFYTSTATGYNLKVRYQGTSGDWDKVSKDGWNGYTPFTMEYSASPKL